ncbi:putative oxidoreductase YdgJ [Posidoniimonas corsicana]|uniref:Putative oxidoreductase YdgJ n=1 Tax=Posidoniimonas corsicana TaxID=1938618 RepID=A0A5C5USM8_9BACT|nr:putative oxidoreductase YdgJ [Posidoniimonas corsicana]
MSRSPPSLQEHRLNPIDRRTFLHAAAASGALTSAAPSLANPASSDVTFALMGANSRGSQLAKRFLKFPGVRFAYVCDPDERALAKGLKTIADNDGGRPRGVKDFRTALDDPHVDALICAAPNHWHAAATVAACAAGKHVYVEKPCTHTAWEGQVMQDAAERSGRVVQVGTQRRSSPMYQEVMQKAREGVIGEVLYAKSWYLRDRPPIKLQAADGPPAGLDYRLWQGPAPDRNYQAGLLPYNWHWFWHWGNGEIGNNGVHMIDLCRWVLGMDLPERVSCDASQLRPGDQRQTPDSTVAVYDQGGKRIVWEGLSWSSPHQTAGGVGMEFRGTQGTLIVGDNGYEVYNAGRELVERQQRGGVGDDEHCINFLSAVRSGAAVNAPLDEGCRSALFCHLANIAYRTGGVLATDPQSGRINDNPAAMRLWDREYQPGWAPQELG